MADRLIGSTLASLINGVSQQPAHLRPPSQGDEQLNLLSRIEDGPTRRPPTEHVDKLMTTAPPTGGYAVHIYERDSAEKYIVLMSDNAKPRVFDFEGNEATVNEPNGHGYMNFDTTLYTAKQAFAAVTIADTTFIVNRTLPVALSGSPADDRANEFLLVSKADGVTRHKVTVTIDGTEETVDSAAEDLSDNIINAMYTAVDATATDWEFLKVGEGEGGNQTYVLYGQQVADTGNPQTVTASDNLGGRMHTLIYKSVQRFSDLPNIAPDGFTVEIIGDGGDEGDSYWVQYVEAENAWLETVAPGLDNDFDLDTMPYTLVRIAVSPLEFTFRRTTWASRLKGDAISAPDPSFVEQTIKDVAVHKNRLAFIAAENVILSEAGNFFNFFPTTVTTIVESDPLDISSSSNRVAFLDWAVPFDGKLLLMSARGGVQSEVSSPDLKLTPQDTVVAEKTAYDSSDLVRPIALGKSVYWPVDRETASGFMEYRSSNEAVSTVLVEEVTSHIPTYLPANITSLAVSSTENMLIAHSGDEPNALFVYRTYSTGEGKVQSSWSRWELAPNAEIQGVAILRSTIWVVMYVPNDGIHLEKLRLRALEDGDLGWRLCLDSQVEVTGVHSAGVTTFTLPYDNADFGGTYRIVKSDEGWDQNLGQLITVLSQAGHGTITASGDYSAYPVRIGREFESSYTLSPIVIQQGAGRGAVPVTLGRLQLKALTFLYSDTGTFTVTISRRDLDDEPEYTHVMPGREVGGPQLIGPVTLNTGEFRVAVLGEARHVRVAVSSTAITPFTLVGVDWVGHYGSDASPV